MPRSTAWGRAIDRLLADGEWHHREDVYAAGMCAVPHGIGVRTAIKRRKDGGSTALDARPTDRVVGARRRVVYTVAKSVRDHGTLEFSDEVLDSKGRPNGEFVRLKPKVVQ